MFINISTNQKNRSSLFHWKNLAMKYSILIKMIANVFAIFITNVDIEKTFNLTHQIIDVNYVWLFSKKIKQIMMLKYFFNFVLFKKKIFPLNSNNVHQKNKNRLFESKLMNKTKSQTLLCQCSRWKMWKMKKMWMMSLKMISIKIIENF